MRQTALFVLSLVFFVSSSSIYAERRPMTTDDGLNMVGLGDVLIAPDGKAVFYELRQPDWEENKRKSKYHFISAEGGESFQYIGEAGGSDFQFSPEGTYLSFKRKVDEDSQLFYMRMSGGEAVQLTEHDTPVGPYKWTADERSIVFVAPEPLGKEEKKERENGHDAIFVDEGPSGQKEGHWKNLWKIDLEADEAVRLTDDEIIVGKFDISPKMDRIVFLARKENRRNQKNLSELYMLTLQDTTYTQLTNNNAPEYDPIWSPDGKEIAYMAPDDKTWELRHRKIWVIDAESRKHRVVSLAFEGRIQRYTWTPDSKSILFAGIYRTDSNLFRLGVKSGRVTQVTKVSGELQVRSFSKDRKRMVYSYSDFGTPPDLYISPTNRLKAVRLTHLNPTITDSLLLAKAELVRWTSRDSLEIEGLLILPPGYDRSQRIPLILHVHGGPAGKFVNSFRYRTQVWAGLGYAQLLPNVRGSSGYSDAFLRGNFEDIGGGDFEDLMSGVDHLIQMGYVDPDRMGIRGWSYGGILGGWTITQTERFKAASLGAMVSDWTSEYGPGLNYDVRLWYIGGTPWDNPEAWRFRSPLTHAANVTTPTLLLHGIADDIDTEPQSMMFYSALKDMGKTVRYIRFPRELHGFKEPRHLRVRDIEEIRWMQKHVLGEDWEPWERPKSKTEDEEDSSKAEPVLESP